MNEPIVSKPVPEPCQPSLEEWQSAFFDCRGRLCPTMPSAAHAERYLDFLKHRIARQPKDLLAHVRRVLIARAHRQSRVVAEALHDLFRVLTNKGAGLRAHLLDLCAPLLDAQTMQYLRRMSAPSSAPALAFVIRTTGPQTAARSAASVKATAVTEALAHLEDGQVDEARVLLERHLKTAPNDAEATDVLLDLYLRARDHHAFESMRQQLEPLPEAVRPLWAAAAARLAKSA